MAKKYFTRAVCILICLVLLPFDLAANAALFTFETQYDHDSADLAWLTDLIIKEDMDTVGGLAERLTLNAKPDYPYTETAESFSRDVKYFCSLYNLDEGAQRTALIYLFQLVGTQSGLLAADTSDEDIRAYLEGMGIKYPTDVGSDELIAARALYVAMVTGTFGAFSGGASLEETLVAYAASLTGMNTAQLKEWAPDSAILSLDDYLLAASKLTLWTNGYDVSADTDSDTVFRLIAVMTMEKMGISVDSGLSFEELKLKYTAAMLSQKYNVTLDTAKLRTAIAADSVDFYILQLIGKRDGLSVRTDNTTYSQAFDFVAENTDEFDIIAGEFYADIMNYEVELKYKRDKLWFYPTAYLTGNDSYILAIDVNGRAIRNNYYTEVPIEPESAEQTLKITVVATSSSGKTAKCVYNILVRQGKTEYSAAPDGGNQEPTSEMFQSSESLVTDILSSLGINTSISSIFSNIYSSLPVSIKNTVSYMAPTFAGGTPSDSAAEKNDAEYIDLLDRVGSIVDAKVTGIYGIDFLQNMETEFSPKNYVTFE